MPKLQPFCFGIDSLVDSSVVRHANINYLLKVFDTNGNKNYKLCVSVHWNEWMWVITIETESTQREKLLRDLSVFYPGNRSRQIQCSRSLRHARYFLYRFKLARWVAETQVISQEQVSDATRKRGGGARLLRIRYFTLKLNAGIWNPLRHITHTSAIISRHRSIEQRAHCAPWKFCTAQFSPMCRMVTFPHSVSAYPDMGKTVAIHDKTKTHRHTIPGEYPSHEMILIRDRWH